MNTTYIIFATFTIIALLTLSCRDSKNEPSGVENEEETEADLTFGYKTCWLAIPSEDTDAIARKLNLRNTQACVWSKGIQESYTGKIFITPPVDGWSFVVSTELGVFDQDEKTTNDFINFLNNMATAFPDFYYFATHRVVEYHSWVKVKDGKIVRAYAFLGETGETLINQGQQSAAEKQLGFDFFDDKCPEAQDEEYFEREDLRYPDEEDVMRLSQEWSISTHDPNKFKHIETAGILGDK